MSHLRPRDFGAKEKICQFMLRNLLSLLYQQMSFHPVWVSKPLLCTSHRLDTSVFKEIFPLHPKPCALIHEGNHWMRWAPCLLMRMINEMVHKEKQIPSLQLNHRPKFPENQPRPSEHSKRAKATHPVEESLHVPVYLSLDQLVFHGDINCAPCLCTTQTVLFSI